MNLNKCFLLYIIFFVTLQLNDLSSKINTL